MKIPLFAIIFCAGLAGCSSSRPVPALPVNVPVVPDPAMQRAVASIESHGYPVPFIPVPEAYTVTMMSEDAVVNGARCFFLDRVADAETVARAKTGSFTGRKCVQGYSVLEAFPAQIYMVEGAPVDHELKHLLFWYNYPAADCPVGIGFQYSFIEHGGPCDPFEIKK